MTTGLYAYHLLKKEVLIFHRRINQLVASIEIQAFLKRDLLQKELAIFGCDGRYQFCLQYLPPKSHARLKPEAQILILSSITPQQTVLNKAYKSGAQMTELPTIAYYLGKPLRAEAFSSVFALYRDDWSKNAEEILTDIVDLELDYQVSDTVGQASFKPATDIINSAWSTVCGLRLKVRFIGGLVKTYVFSLSKRGCINRRAHTHDINEPLRDPSH
jgi:hypothetical protein